MISLSHVVRIVSAAVAGVMVCGAAQAGWTASSPSLNGPSLDGATHGIVNNGSSLDGVTRGSMNGPSIDGVQHGLNGPSSTAAWCAATVPRSMARSTVSVAMARRWTA